MQVDDYKGINAFMEYMAIRLHFTSGYDYFKYNGKTKIKPHTFLARKDKYFFEKIGGKYKNGELVDFFMANFVNDTPAWSGSIAGDQGEKAYLKWLGKIQSLSYKTKEELNVAKKRKGDSPISSLFMNKNGHPLLLKMYLGGQVSKETMLLLNRQYRHFGYWNKTMEGDLIWENEYNALQNYKPFFFKKCKMRPDEFISLFTSVFT